MRHEAGVSIKEVGRQRAININYLSVSKVLRTEQFYLSPSPATQRHREPNKYQNKPASSTEIGESWSFINCNEWRICLRTIRLFTLPSTQTCQTSCVEVGKVFVANIIHAIVEAEVIFFYWPKKFL